MSGTDHNFKEGSFAKIPWVEYFEDNRGRPLDLFYTSGRWSVMKIEGVENGFAHGYIDWANDDPDSEDGDEVYEVDVSCLRPINRKKEQGENKMEKEKLFEEVFKEAELKKPSFFKRMMFDTHVNNEDDLYTVGVTEELDNFIDDAIKDGREVKDITDEIWNLDYYKKSFTKSGNKKSDVETYVFRRQQRIKHGKWGKGSGEGRQQLLPGLFENVYRESAIGEDKVLLMACQKASDIFAEVYPEINYYKLSGDLYKFLEKRITKYKDKE